MTKKWITKDTQQIYNSETEKSTYNGYKENKILTLKNVIQTIRQIKNITT